MSAPKSASKSIFGELADLRDSFFAARMVREEILAAPVRPPDRARLAAETLARNGVTAAERAAVARAGELGRDPDFQRVDADMLRELAAAAGSAHPRRGSGATFHGQPPPPKGKFTGLLDEILETVNAPLAVEVWPPFLRALSLHFLLRLVQPFEAPSEAVGLAGEALLLSVDGFAPERVLLAESAVVGEPHLGRPDPDGFARARTHRFVERLTEGLDEVRRATARAVLLSWVEERGAALNARQEQLLRYLAADGGRREMSFQDYVNLHAGRRAPALRTLQRDWQVLRERGWLEPTGERFRLSTAPLAFGH